MSSMENLETELAQMEHRVAAAEAIARDARLAFENFRQRWTPEDITALQSVPHDQRLKARLEGSDPLTAAEARSIYGVGNGPVGQSGGG